MPATDTRTGTIITLALSDTATITSFYIPASTVIIVGILTSPRMMSPGTAALLSSRLLTPTSTIIMIIKVRDTRTAITVCFPTGSLLCWE